MSILNNEQLDSTRLSHVSSVSDGVSVEDLARSFSDNSVSTTASTTADSDWSASSSASSAEDETTRKDQARSNATNSVKKNATGGSPLKNTSHTSGDATDGSTAAASKKKAKNNKAKGAGGLVSKLAATSLKHLDKASKENCVLYRKESFGLAERWTRLKTNTMILQRELISQGLDQSCVVTGNTYVVHLRPRYREAEKDFTQSYYLSKLLEIQKQVPEVDVYSRPSVERALDKRLAISTGDDRPNLRIAVTAMHTEKAIVDLIKALRMAIS